ncbi:MAG: TlpA family protein disulfide reductase, partial [Thermoplasmata archaeon]
SEEERAVIETRRRRKPALPRRESLLYPVVAVVIVVVLVLVVVYNPGQQSHEPTTAPDFTLTSSDGEQVHLADYRGNVILLDFMDTDCHFCQEETAEVLVPLHAAYGSRVVFISVDVGFVGDSDTFGDIITFKAFYGATWTYVLDDGTVAQKYGVTGTPTTFLLKKDLTVHSTFRGMTDYDTLSASLDAALGG